MKPENNARRSWAQHKGLVTGFVLGSIVGAPLLLNAASSQNGITGLWRFNAGEPIYKDEVNANFSLLGEHMRIFQSALAILEGEPSSRVGIGVEAPSARSMLHVQGIPSDLELILESDGASPDLNFALDGHVQGQIVYDKDDHAFGFSAVAPDASVGYTGINGDENRLMTLKQSGQLGLGVRDPAEQLEIAGGGVYLAEDDIHLSTSSHPNELRFDSEEGAVSFNGGGSISGGDAYVSVGQVPGRIGIGTSEPTVELDVAGKIRATGSLEGSNVNHLVWSTNVGGTYDLTDIFDDARRAGMSYGVWDCVLRTDNEAHWTGRRFTASVNAYIANPTHTHHFYSPLNVEASPAGGCDGGLTSFDASTGAFTLVPGSCGQRISLKCNLLF